MASKAYNIYCLVLYRKKFSNLEQNTHIFVMPKKDYNKSSLNIIDRCLKTGHRYIYLWSRDVLIHAYGGINWGWLIGTKIQ